MVDLWHSLSGCRLREGDIFGWRRYSLFVFVLIKQSIPGIFLDFIDLLEQTLLLWLFSLPRSRLNKAQLAHFFMLHESAFHATLEVLDLMVSASFGNELMLGDTIGVIFCLVVAFVEMVKREGTSIGGLGHNNYLWWNRIRIKVQISRRIRESHLYSIIIFLILTSWTKNQQSLIAKFTTSTSPASKKSHTPNISNRNSVSNTHVPSNTSASAVVTASFAVSAFPQENTHSTTSRISKEASNFSKVSFKNGT